MPITSGDLAKRFSKSRTAINNWVKEFGDEFLNPQKGKYREFNHEELTVMATINHLSNEGMNYDSIKEKLRDGFRIEVRNIRPDDIELIPAAAMEQVLDATEIRMELEHAIAEKKKLEEILTSREEEIRQLRVAKDNAIAQADKLKDGFHDEVKTLLARAERAETEARIYKEQLQKLEEEIDSLKKPRSFFGR